MRSGRVLRAADSQCRSRNCPGFDLSILRHSGILGAADEAVLNIVHKRKHPKKSPFKQIQQAAPNLKNGKNFPPITWNEEEVSNYTKSAAFLSTITET
jgi:hypothetical protein